MFLRIGSQILSRESSGRYTRTFDADRMDHTFPWYFEDFAARRQYVALVSRQKPPKPPISIKNESTLPETSNAPKEDDADSEESGLYSTPSVSLEATSVKSNKDTKVTISESSSDTDDKNRVRSANSDSESEVHDDVSETSVSIELDSDEEDWTEGSTDLEQMGFSTLDNDDEDSSVPSSDVSSDVESCNTSETDEEHPSGGPRGPHFDDSDSGQDVAFDDDDNGACRPDSNGPTSRRIAKSGIPRGTITIFDISQEPPRLVFQYQHELPVMLYDSPPAFHPTKPLVVWPLCGGNILFADFVAKTYFIRKSRPTSHHSKSLGACLDKCCG